MKKHLLYFYLGAMFASLFGAGSLPQTYQKPAIVFGLFLFGMFLTFGMTYIWLNKIPLKGRGLNIEFSKHPFIYSIWLLVVFGFGLAMLTAALAFTISHALGTVLVPWLG